jgi:nitrate reductase NapE component
MPNFMGNISEAGERQKTKDKRQKTKDEKPVLYLALCLWPLA